MKLQFEYPKSKPVWLDKWPNNATIQRLFPDGLRRYGIKIISKERINSLLWSDKTLRLNVGNQSVTWRLAADGKWSRHCSCGYKNDLCAHAFAATKLLDQVLKFEGWREGNAKFSPTPRLRSSQLRQTSDYRKTKQATSFYTRELDLFSSLPQEVAKIALEIEVDFHHEPTKRVLRFYQTIDGKRNILRTQQLYSLAMRARSKVLKLEQWGDDNLAFLDWLGVKLKNRIELKQNLNVIKLTINEFELWQEYWEDTPGRFFDRATQQPLNAAKHKTKMTIELENKGEWTQISAVLTLSSGKKYLFHDIFKMLSANHGNLVADGQMLDFAPPLPMKTICEMFSKKSPRMRHEHICEHLPNLINDRLDILAGSAVKHLKKSGEISIEAKEHNADVILRITISGALLHPATMRATSKLIDQGTHFGVVSYDNKFLKKLKSMLKKLDYKIENNGSLQISSELKSINSLLNFWETLPNDIQKIVDSKLAGLLGEKVKIAPDMMIRGGGSFVDLHLNWQVGDTIITDRELADALKGEQKIFRASNGSWFKIDNEVVRQQRESMLDLGFADGASQRLFKPDASKVIQTIDDTLECNFICQDRSFLDRLRTEPDAPLLPLPKNLSGILRDYQKEGFEFLSNRCAYGIGAILADDMGLGKTVQTLAMISALTIDQKKRETTTKSEGCVVICPASVVNVWAAESAKFCPELGVVKYVGTPSERAKILNASSWDLMIMTYAIARIDLKQLLEKNFAAIILDEAQYIKNPDSKVAKAVKLLRTSQAIALTGTPLENRLLDLWSIVDFVNPGFLGEKDLFVANYEASGKFRAVAKKVKPILIRRTKEAVATELPPRTEELISIELNEDERNAYHRELLKARQAVQEKGAIEMLAALTRLRQLCCDQRLVSKRQTEVPSSKLKFLMERLTTLLAEGHSALIFSQFTTMLQHIEDAIGTTMPIRKITGKTSMKNRAKMVEDFNNSDQPEVFLLSLKAAGTGLTLTKADYVFIFDPWWNPASERQAIDRTHRIGQDKPVFAYRLVATDTVEEKVIAMQQEKARIFNEVMEGAEGAIPQRLSSDDLKQLLL